MIPLDKLALFGTPEFPLRPSALATLTKCSVWYVMQYGEDDGAGTAAQTGSVVHAGIAAFHTAEEKQRVDAAMSALSTALLKFPLAEKDEARLYLTPYLKDPRNEAAVFARRNGAPYATLGYPAWPADWKDGDVGIEVPVRLTLDPHPLDPTELPIQINGTIDQIRIEHGKQLVDDVKTGRKTGFEMTHDYAYQQAAYVLAARASGFPDAEPGRIIRMYCYRERGAKGDPAKGNSPVGVFCANGFDVKGAELLMEKVRLAVALIRQGVADFGAGYWCTFCPYGGLDQCIPRANERIFQLPMAERERLPDEVGSH